MDANEGFDDAVLGGGLGAAAEAALAEAARHRSEPQGQALAMAALMRAQALAPEHPAVLIAFYRYHFYGHRPAAARDTARRALVIAARALGLPPLWRDAPERPLPEARTHPRTRFFLFLLKGYAYLSLRLGDEREAREALAKLRLLDPDDAVGASVIEAVRVRALVGEDDHEGAGREPGDRPAASVTGAAAWAQAARGGAAAS